MSLGGFASGGVSQATVANTLKSKAKEDAVSFIISPGSNFMGGVTNLTDIKWNAFFETPYRGSSMRLPFFTVVGSEDWKGNYTALPMRTNQTYSMGKETHSKIHTNQTYSMGKETYSIGKEAHATSTEGFPRWFLPNWWYYYTAHFSDATGANAAFTNSDTSAVFVFVDTFILSNSFRFQNITKLHWNELRDTIAAAVRIFDWVIAVGDKAMISNGRSKGDNYLNNTLGPFLKDMKVDAYISGNDPDMEIVEDGSLLHINCGAGSDGIAASQKVNNTVVYVGTPGFCLHTLRKEAFYTEIVDGNTGQIKGNYTKSRNMRDRSLVNRFMLYKGLPEIIFIEIPKGVIEPPGKRVRKPPTEDDLFVKIVGTLGLLILLALLVLLTIALVHKIANSGK